MRHHFKEECGMLRKMMTDRAGGAVKVAALAVGLVVVSGMLGGCAKNKGGGELEALRDENTSLREQLAQLENALDTCEDRNANLVADRDAAVSEAERLRSGAGSQMASNPFGSLPGVDVSQRGGEIVLNIAGDVLFASGQTTLRNDAKRTLDQIASVLQSQYGNNQIRIAGHTDSDPIKKSQWKTNERLSAERAMAVEDYLSSRGLSKNNMYIAGYGSAQPRGDKQSSRRVEIIVLAGG
mgnify:CR=1 FL=1